MKDFLRNFQEGDSIEFRDEEISTEDRIKEYIFILEKEYCDFEKELKHRQANGAESAKEEKTLFGNGYERSCQSINELTALINKIKQLTK